MVDPFVMLGAAGALGIIALAAHLLGKWMDRTGRR